MADLDDLPDLDQSAAAFLTAYAAYYAEAFNRNPRLGIADKAQRSVAQNANHHEGVGLVLQGFLAEQRVTGRVKLGDNYLIRSTVTPNTNVIGSPGDVCVVTDGTLWTKVSGVATDTGWSELASAGGSSTLHIIGNAGGVDGNFDTAEFDEQDFGLTDNADGSVSIALNQLQLSNLPAGVDRTLFTYATTAGPASTTTPTDILSQSISGNTLSADGQQLHVELRGDDFNQSGVGITWEIAVLLGGVEIYRDTQNSRSSSTTRRPWILTFSMTRLTSTTLHMSGHFRSSTSAGAPDTGLGDLTSAAVMDCALSSAVASPTVAWGSSQTLQVRITASTAGANTDFTRRSGIIMRRAA